MNGRVTGRLTRRSSVLLFMILPSMILFSRGVSAVEPLFETTCVFPVAVENKPNYRIPAIIQAPNGDLLILAEKRNDGPGDVGDHDIVSKRSRDKGRTWSAGRTIWPHPASYSDIAVLDDMTIGFVYERGDKGSTHYWDELHFARFNLEWLTDGRDSVR